MPHNNFLHSSCFNIPGAPEQLPAFIWFYIWFHRGLLKSPPPVPLHSFPHSCGFNISAFPRLSPASCMCRHLGSISKLSPLVPLTNFLHSFAWSQDFTSGLLTTFCMHLNLVSKSKLPPLSLNNFLRSPGFNIYLTPLCLSSNFVNFLHSLSFNI